MIHRKEFLMALFRILEQASVPYCVLRNYDGIYENLSSDVDIIVETEHLGRFKDCLANAASESGHRFLLRARYVNYSYVYWHPQGGFLRIDVETEVRWRVFPVLTAKAVIGLRRKCGAFYIPHPRHESVILFVAALWRGSLSDRYRKQLASLYRELSNPLQLGRTFRSIFGAAGPKLVGLQEKILQNDSRARPWRGLKRALILNAFRNRPNRRALLRYFIEDIKRFWERLIQPPGISLLYVSASQRHGVTDELFRQIEFLYPAQKAMKFAFPVSGEAMVNTRLSLWLRLSRLYVLFKGGLFLRFYQSSSDSGLGRALSAHARYFFPSRTFLVGEDSAGAIYMAHVKTGFMTCLPPVETASSASKQIIEFISAILERTHTRNRRRKRGLFAVLVGLDGSGKTTLARTMCCQAIRQNAFSGIRYHHWQPQLWGGVKFPWPEGQNVPRKAPLKASLLQSILSVARLAKNLLWARISHFMLIRPKLRRGALVILDRYYYNYYLDPVSVKYYAPPRLLDSIRTLFPRPDLVLVLKAPAEVLLARKQELSRDEIIRQIGILETMDFASRQTLTVDASRPASDVSEEVLAKIAQITG